MGTVKQTITDAMRELVVLTEGDEATADQIAAGKSKLQDMISLWSIDGLMVPYETKETFTLTAGTQTYNWAPGQSAPHFNSMSPVRVLAATFVLSTYRKALYAGDSRLLAQVPVTGRSAEPTFYYFDRQIIPTLSFDVAPYGGGVEVISEKPLDDTLVLTEEMAFPTYYNLLLVYNLAILLAPSYGKSVTQELAFNARETKKSVERYNAQPAPTLRSPVPNPQRRRLPISLR